MQNETNKPSELLSHRIQKLVQISAETLTLELNFISSDEEAIPMEINFNRLTEAKKNITDLQDKLTFIYASFKANEIREQSGEK